MLKAGALCDGRVLWPVVQRSALIGPKLINYRCYCCTLRKRTEVRVEGWALADHRATNAHQGSEEHYRRDLEYKM